MQRARAGLVPKSFLDPSENRLLPASPSPQLLQAHADASESGSPDSQDTRLSHQARGSLIAVKAQLCPSSHFTDFLNILSVQLAAAQFIKCSLSSGWDFRELHVLLIPLRTDNCVFK